MERADQSGIVLAVRESGEADSIADILTRTGRRSIVFKGIRKTRKRDTGVCYPGCVIIFGARDSHGPLRAAAHFSLTYLPTAVQKDYTANIVLQILLETLLRTTPEAENTAALHDTAEAAIRYLGDGASPPHLLAGVMARMLRIHGILPSFASGETGEKIIARGRLAPDDVRYIGELTGKPFHEVNHDAVSAAAARRIALALARFMEDCYHIRLRSLAMLTTTENDDD